MGFGYKHKSQVLLSIKNIYSGTGLYYSAFEYWLMLFMEFSKLGKYSFDISTLSVRRSEIINASLICYQLNVLATNTFKLGKTFGMTRYRYHYIKTKLQNEDLYFHVFMEYEKNIHAHCRHLSTDFGYLC